MSKKKKVVANIEPGTPEWESICEQCGLCCLVKYCDENGFVHLTRLACDNMDLETGKCRCYSVDVEKRGDAECGCVAHNGAKLNYGTLNNDYVVPGFCPYVKKLANAKDKVKRLKRPDLTGIQIVPESVRKEGESYVPYIIKDTWKFFKYNPHVNQRFVQEMKGKKR